MNSLKFCFAVAVTLEEQSAAEHAHCSHVPHQEKPHLECVLPGRLCWAQAALLLSVSELRKALPGQTDLCSGLRNALCTQCLPHYPQHRLGHTGLNESSCRGRKGRRLLSFP